MKVLSLILFVLLINSCQVSKKLKEVRTSMNQSEISQTTKDSTQNKIVNSEINDEFVIPLGTVDSLVTARIKQVLRDFDYRKNS